MAETWKTVAYVEDVQAQGEVLDDFNTLGAPTSDGQFIVATGVGTFAYEATTMARTSLGIGEGDSPTLAGLTLTNATVISSDSVVFQPNTDSTTFFQVLDANGGVPVLNIDTTNEKVGLRTDAPEGILHTVAVDFSDQVVMERSGRTSNTLFGATKLRATKTSIMGDGFGVGFVFEIDDGDGPNNIGLIGATRDGADNSGMIEFKTYTLGGNSVRRLGIKNSGEVIIGSHRSPATLFELQGIAPYFSIHNSTQEDSDGGREGRIEFRGQQSSTEETILARIEASHDGAVNDQNGQLRVFTNDGDDDDAPTLRTKWGYDGMLQHGDGGVTNYVQWAANGDQTFAGSAGFYPRFLTQANEPAAGTGATQCDTSEMVVWKDSDDSKVYMCFNDGGTVKTVELA